MGGEGPYVSFNENYHPGGPAFSKTAPHPLDDKQLDAAYTRAHGFLFKIVGQLVELGWEPHETDDSLLAFLSYTRVLSSHWGDRESHVELRLPRKSSSWFEPSLVQQWKKMFGSTLFEVRRYEGRDAASDPYAAYLHVHSEPPLRDIFNFLQCLIPDMFVIIRVDDIDDIGEEEITRRLPSSKWVTDYAGELCPIFGEERFKDMMQASKTSAIVSRMVSSYLDYDDEDEADDRDFTACDKECGYCGRCEY